MFKISLKIQNLFSCCYTVVKGFIANEPPIKAVESIADVLMTSNCDLSVIHEATVRDALKYVDGQAKFLQTEILYFNIL